MPRVKAPEYKPLSAKTLLTLPRVRIAALMTCHNRCEITLAGLDYLFKSASNMEDRIELKTFLVDDGSTDGTNLAVKKQFSGVEIIEGDGSLYWNGGMRTAFASAVTQDFDAYLLVNDDTELYDYAIAKLLDVFVAKTSISSDKVIVVGTTQAPGSEGITYGGLRKGPWWKPLQFTRVMPESNRSVPCDTFNCNCVLLSRSVAQLVGNLDDAFTHAMGDFDYGLRASNLGCSLWVAPGFIGECELNRGKGLWSDSRLSLLARWSRLIGPKGLPPMEWLVFTRRHSGPFWPLYWLNPYLSFWWSAPRYLLTRHKEISQP